MAQLQRAVRQAGERLAALETQVGTFASHTDVDSLRKTLTGHLDRAGVRRAELSTLYDRVTNLEISAHEKVENEYDRLAALDLIHADGTREDGGIGHGFLVPDVQGRTMENTIDRMVRLGTVVEDDIAALSGKLIAVRSRGATWKPDKSCPVQPFWKSASPCWKAISATSRGWKYGAANCTPAHYCRGVRATERICTGAECTSEYLATDEPAEVAEPVDSDYRHPDGEPIYDLDT